MEAVLEGAKIISSGGRHMPETLNVSSNVGEVQEGEGKTKFLDIFAKWKGVAEDLMQVIPLVKKAGYMLDYEWTEGQPGPAMPNQGPSNEAPAYTVRLKLVKVRDMPAPSKESIAVASKPFDDLKEQATELGISFNNRTPMVALQQLVTTKLQEKSKK